MTNYRNLIALYLCVTAAQYSLAQEELTYSQKTPHTMLLYRFQGEIVGTGTVSGIDASRNAGAIEFLKNTSIAEVQIEAFEPFRAEMCAEIEKDEPNVLLAAQLFDSGVDAEESATQELFNAFVDRLSRNSQMELASDMQERQKDSQLSARLHWVVMAEETPGKVIYVFRSACERREKR